MEATEKYEIIIAFVGKVAPNKVYVDLVWNLAIREEFKSSGIYINAIIDERSLACVDCSDSETCFFVVAVRNPAQTQFEEDYYNALGRIMFKVREELNNPYMFIMSEKINASYFPQAE